MIKIIGVIVVGTAVLVGIASRYIFKKTDNFIEETAEEIIKDKTGWDIDLSPDTPEIPVEEVPEEQKDYDGKDK